MHISQKSSTFALALRRSTSQFAERAAIVAQLVEQRIRNAWVAGSSPASGSKTKKEGFMPSFCFYAIHPMDENRLGAPTKLRSDFMGKSDD